MSNSFRGRSPKYHTLFQGDVLYFLLYSKSKHFNLTLFSLIVILLPNKQIRIVGYEMS